MNKNLPDGYFRLVLLVCLVLLLLPVQPVSADIGPKPQMSFKFDFKIPEVDIVKATLIECKDADCKSGEPLREIGPQRLSCSLKGCSVIAYGFGKYHKLVIQFTDRTRESEVFTREALSATFTITVLEDRLSVKENHALCCYLPAAALTIFIELLLASLYLGAFGLPRLVLGWVPVASLVTLPFVWSVFPLLIVPGLILTAISEVFAVGVEAVLIYQMTAKALTLRHTLILSLLMNAASFGVGLWLLI